MHARARVRMSIKDAWPRENEKTERETKRVQTAAHRAGAPYGTSKKVWGNLTILLTTTPDKQCMLSPKEPNKMQNKPLTHPSPPGGITVRTQVRAAWQVQCLRDWYNNNWENKCCQGSSGCIDCVKSCRQFANQVYLPQYVKDETVKCAENSWCFSK